MWSCKTECKAYVYGQLVGILHNVVDISGDKKSGIHTEPRCDKSTQAVAKKEEAIPVKAEPQTVTQQPATSAYLDSASYKITGTKTKYTIKEGETLTRVSLRFYGTKAMWPYIVKHNPKVIKNPNNVPYGTTIEIPELTKE